KVGDFRFSPHVLPQEKDLLGLAAQGEKPPLSTALDHAARSAPKIAPEDAEVIAKDRAFNALTRTTCVATMLRASPQDNVLPTDPEAVINCRIMPDETREATEKALTDAIGDPRVAISKYSDVAYGPLEELSGDVPAAIKKATGKVFPKAAVVGTMGTGATDS